MLCLSPAPANALPDGKVHFSVATALVERTAMQGNCSRPFEMCKDEEQDIQLVLISADAAVDN
jgi:hypothetical protein